jgi:hypothetical protein
VYSRCILACIIITMFFLILICKITFIESVPTYDLDFVNTLVNLNKYLSYELYN